MKKTINYFIVSFFIIFFSSSAIASNDQKVGLDAIRLLSQVIYRVKQNYVEEVSDKQLADGCAVGLTNGKITQPLYSGSESVSDSDVNLDLARFLSRLLAGEKIKSNASDDELIESCVTGIMKTLDSRSSFIGKEEFQDIFTRTKKFFGGVGMVLIIKNDYPVVISPIDDAPAARAGIRSGDSILLINNEDMQGVSLEKVVSKLRGKPGTQVQLLVERVNTLRPLSFNLEREIVKTASVKEQLLDNNIGYIRISTFNNKTGRKVKNKLSRLSKNTNGGLKGLILDLRNNPGGLLNEAILVADMFLADGLIVSAKARHKNSDLKYVADSKQYLEGIPIVILVNEGTASASEIVSGALKYYERAILLGKKTFGSGSIQSVIPLGNNTALKLTTSKWVTPGGDFIHEKGIKPDIEVDDSVDKFEDMQLKRALIYLNR